jgi:hypothetical protein
MVVFIGRHSFLQYKENVFLKKTVAEIFRLNCYDESEFI